MENVEQTLSGPVVEYVDQWWSNHQVDRFINSLVLGRPLGRTFRFGTKQLPLASYAILVYRLTGSHRQPTILLLTSTGYMIRPVIGRECRKITIWLTYQPQVAKSFRTQVGC